MPAWFRRRQIWLPTWQGALLLVVVVAAASLIALRHLGSYLATNDPVAESRTHCGVPLRHSRRLQIFAEKSRLGT